MTAPAETDEFPAPPFDTSAPHPARVYDYLLGGKDNYAADRRAAGELQKAVPEAAASARANRMFLGRAVRYLAGQQGIRQFLDIGTGIPTAGSTHQVAQAIAPQSRVAYVDNDPVVLAHARALLVGSGAGATEYIQADLRQPLKVLSTAAQLLDFTKPAALLLVAVLHFIPDEDGPAGLLAAYRAALAPGSYLVISHGTGDFHDPAAVAAAAEAFDRAPASLTPRRRQDIAPFFGDFELEPPGLVQVPAWRPDTAAAPDAPGKTGVYGGLARKIK